MKEITEYLAQLQVRTNGLHSLPFSDMLPSRICTAIAFSFYGISKDVIKLNLILCLGSRDFIITQEGLKGFLLREHDNFNSLLFELQVSQDFA